MITEPWLFLFSLAGIMAAACFLVWVGGRMREMIWSPGVPRLSLLVVVRDASPWVEGLVREIYWLEDIWSGLRAEVLVVDDGSADETPLILERLRREYGSLRVLQAGPGGPALETGVAACRSPVILVLRADASAEPRLVIRTVRSLLGRRAGRRVEEKRAAR